jgi:hypothetical protein
MFRKTLALVLTGILLAGSATVAYGTFYDKGFAASVKSVVGAGEEEGDGHHGGGQEDEHDD